MWGDEADGMGLESAQGPRVMNSSRIRRLTDLGGGVEVTRLDGEGKQGSRCPAPQTVAKVRMHGGTVRRTKPDLLEDMRGSERRGEGKYVH